jgi:hypothetical protein
MRFENFLKRFYKEKNVRNLGLCAVFIIQSMNGVASTTLLTTKSSIIDYINSANVFFDVVTTSSGLELIGNENGQAVFQAKILNNDINNGWLTFDEISQGPFFAVKAEGGFRWGYASKDSGEIVDFLVTPNGNITFLQSVQNYVGHDSKKGMLLGLQEPLKILGTLLFMT